MRHKYIAIKKREDTKEFGSKKRKVNEKKKSSNEPKRMKNEE